jgi:hypothetical protein
MMKNILRSSLAVMAIAGLAACGGGGSSDVADTYVGTWKSKCFAYTGNDGNTYYQTQKLNLAKAAAAELAATYTESKAHSDSACVNLLGSINNGPAIKINIGVEETFLGAPAHYMVYTNVATGEARQGYLKADSTQLLLVVSDASGERPGGWGRASPYTKQ